MVTIQVAPDSETTCGPSVCGIYFNTNLTNLTNRAGLTSNKETIRFVFLQHAHLEVLPRAISKIRKIRVKRNNAHRNATASNVRYISFQRNLQLKNPPE